MGQGVEIGCKTREGLTSKGPLCKDLKGMGLGRGARQRQQRVQRSQGRSLAGVG